MMLRYSGRSSTPATLRGMTIDAHEHVLDDAWGMNQYLGSYKDMHNATVRKKIYRPDTRH
jgi:hypothetical protein